ncbi:hypothetical protein BGT96224_5324B [Blumeria graminis f. sp. tritici 96224]|uniref:Uncharacterized protein n=2 Tax=Blumeria graminis f. sp. tritici 96224 TaxID=1268274 RepID=A0A656KMB8_BLUGR|nr:hypothetical protein BGT96224_5324B [Blumeria graminis f. sp. tritici 96224]
MLQETAPDNNYLAFITTNARSIWNNNRNEDNQLGINWAGPFMPPATAGTHSSAMDALGHATEEWTKPMADGIDRSLTRSKQQPLDAFYCGAGGWHDELHFFVDIIRFKGRAGDVGKRILMKHSTCDASTCLPHLSP